MKALVLIAALALAACHDDDNGYNSTDNVVTLCPDGSSPDANAVCPQPESNGDKGDVHEP
jgi:hypothetical protein